MMLPPQGGLPPALVQAPPNAGAVTVPQGNRGNVAAALTKVHNAVKMLEEALPLIPMGDELHVEILNAMKSLAKHMKKGDENPQLEQAALIQQLKANAQNGQMAAMARMQSGGQPGQAPAMPTPQPHQPDAA